MFSNSQSEVPLGFLFKILYKIYIIYNILYYILYIKEQEGMGEGGNFSLGLKMKLETQSFNTVILQSAYYTQGMPGTHHGARIQQQKDRQNPCLVESSFWWANVSSTQATTDHCFNPSEVKKKRDKALLHPHLHCPAHHPSSCAHADTSHSLPL